MISADLEKSLNEAINIARRWGHEFISVEHVLSAILHNKKAGRAVVACGGSVEDAQKDLENFFANKLENNVLEKDQAPQPTLAFQRVLQRAAQQAFSSEKKEIDCSDVLVAIWEEENSHARYFLAQQKVTRYALIKFISHGNAEDLDVEDETSQDRSPAGELPGESTDASQAQRQASPNNDQRTNVIKAFTVDLNEKARKGDIDPLIGRTDELERIIQVLCRRKKNNPLFVGEAGVGKTALAEGLALRIVKNEVPDVLKDAQIFSLDLGVLLAGTKFRGDFEERLKALLKQIKRIPKSILFIDEIHTVIGAGSVGGSSMDASNILKPALSSGELRCIGSTTFKEYRKHFESDHAMTRRFQRIDVEEPSIEDTIEIVNGLKEKYEAYHNVRYSKEVLKSAVEWSSKYLRDKKQPDKSIDVLDEVGAYYSMKRTKDQKEVKPRQITQADIRTVIAKIARIPEQGITSSDRKALQNLGEDLKKVVFGQDQAVEAIEAAIRMARSGLGHDDKPIGSFLFTGPTGVGKTELAKQLSQILGIEFIRFDMSEYMERHAVSRLIGAPPGYVGFDEGGLLTDAVNKNPHAVLLLDEIEKAHPDVHNILLQVMDHGTLTDSNGRETDFRNTILIMTTNVGAAELSKGMIGFTRKTGGSEGQDREAMKRAFSPEFRNRIDGIISFAPLELPIIVQVVDKFLGEIEKKLKAKKVQLVVSQEAKEKLAQLGYDPAYGARPLGRVIQEKIKKPLSEELLFGKLSKGGRVSIGLDDVGGFKFEF